MGNKITRTCILDDPISIIVNEILAIGLFLILTFFTLIIYLSKKCTCCTSKMSEIDDLISSLETKNLMMLQNHKNERFTENTRLVKVLEDISETMRPNFFY